MDTSDLYEELADARKEGDLYRIARAIGRLHIRNEDVDVPPKEFRDIVSELGRVRNGIGNQRLKKGYEIARWLMIYKQIELQVSMTEEDHRCICLAADEFVAEKDFRSLAILKHTCEYVGITVNLSIALTEEQQEELTLCYEEIN